MVCNAYKLPSRPCGYDSTSTANVCSEIKCTDVDSSLASSTFCPSYLSTCVYDGVNCVEAQNCPSYTA